MRKLSISLPSIYEDALIRTLKNIRDATRCDYDVILVSPMRPKIEGLENRIVWIEEKIGTGTGCNSGHAAALNKMSGEFVVPWVDDHFVVDGWDVLAINQYQEREKIFNESTRPARRPFALGLRHAWPHHIGTEFGIYYPYFPFIRRSHLKRVGWYDTAFKQGFADSDLALRIWSAGGRCEWSAQTLIVAHPDDDRKGGAMYAQSDMDLFLERWAPKYGVGWDTSHLRSFNIDIEPYFFPTITEGNTVFYNKPEFRDFALSKGWHPNGAATYGAPSR